MAEILKFKYSISILLLAVATIGLSIFDYTGKNVQMLEDTVIVVAGLVLGVYTYFKLYKPYSIVHTAVAISLLLISVPYFCWSILNFSMYGFNGAKLPYYCYIILKLNFIYIIITLYDGIIAVNKKSHR